MLPPDVSMKSTGHAAVKVASERFGGPTLFRKTWGNDDWLIVRLHDLLIDILVFDPDEDETSYHTPGVSERGIERTR